MGEVRMSQIQIKPKTTQNPQVQENEVPVSETPAMKYLVNAFSLNMMKDLNNVTVTLHIKKLTAEEFCEEIRRKGVANAVGHASTINIINMMCNMNLTPNRIEAKLGNNDELLIFQLRKRLDEGKVLTADEVRQMIQNDQVELLKVKVKIQ